jgi:hypothetical protein
MPDDVSAENEVQLQMTRGQLEEVVTTAAASAAVPAAYNLAAMVIEKYADAIAAAPVVGGSLEIRQGVESALQKVAAEAKVIAEGLRRLAVSDSQ